MHAPNGEFSEEQFQAQHPGASVLGRLAHGKRVQLLDLFIHFGLAQRLHFVPSDLCERLLAFVPAPPPPQIHGVDTLDERPGLTVRHTERRALQEVVLLLRSLEPTRITISEKSGWPSSAAQRLIATRLLDGDFYPPEARAVRSAPLRGRCCCWPGAWRPVPARAWR